MDISAHRKKILVTGANGQLGSEFKDLESAYPYYEFLFTSVNELDITKKDDVFSYFREHHPDFCINCAAYTAVDKAEEEQERAFLINSTAVSHLAVACKLTGTKLIHFSTDYAYDSVTDRPIEESDACQPRSVYGLSKRAGEKVLEESDINWICLRVSWLYGAHGHNFVKTMTRLGKERDQLTVISDQKGTPTYAKDLAEVVMRIIHLDKGYREHYNYSNGGVTDWAAFAREIMQIQELSCHIAETTTEAYGSPAPRPLWSVMSHKKITDTFDVDIIAWQQSLSQCILRLQNQVV